MTGSLVTTATLYCTCTKPLPRLMAVKLMEDEAVSSSCVLQSEPQCCCSEAVAIDPYELLAEWERYTRRWYRVCHAERPETEDRLHSPSLLRRIAAVPRRQPSVKVSACKLLGDCSTRSVCGWHTR